MWRFCAHSYSWSRYFSLKNSFIICVSKFGVVIVNQKCKTRSRWRLRRLRSKPTYGMREIKITRSCDQRVMWLYGRKLLIVCNHPARFGGHPYCGHQYKTSYLDITWTVVGGGEYILAVGGWWWMLVDIFWLVVGGGGYILAGGGWWWMEVGGCRWWCVVA